MKRRCVAMILAAGQGKRMGCATQKQYMQLNGYPVLYYSLKQFEESIVDSIVLVVGKGEIQYCQEEIVNRYGFQKVEMIVEGGKERYESVYYGLQAMKEAEYVLIHDGARPLITKEIVERCIEQVQYEHACVVGMPVKDTIKVVDEKQYAKETPNRSTLWLVQTPQAFCFELVKLAYMKMMEQGDTTATDDAMVVEQYANHSIKLIEGSYENIKITTPEDLIIAQTLLKNRS